MERPGRKTLLLWGLSLAILIAVPLMIAQPTYHYIKQIRAQKLVADIGTYFESGKWQEYETKLLAATKLAPDNPDVLLAQARYLTVRKHPAAISFWMDIVEDHPRNPEIWNAFFLASITTGDLKMASLALRGFRQSNPEEINLVREHEVLLLSATGRIEDAIKTARVHLQQGNPGNAFQLSAYRLMLKGSDQDIHRAKAWLWEQAYAENKTSLPAITTLASQDGLSIDEKRKLMTLLNSHPQARLEHGYLATVIDSDIQSAQGKDENKPWVNFIEDKPLPARIQIGRWLLDVGEIEKAKFSMDPQDALIQRDAALLYIDLLVAENRWNELIKFVKNRECPIDSMLVNLFSAKAAFENGLLEQFEIEWKHAFREASDEVNALGYLANYSENQSWNAQAEQICRYLTNIPQGRTRGWIGLYNLAYKTKDTTMMKLAEKELSHLFNIEKSN